MDKDIVSHIQPNAFVLGQNVLEVHNHDNHYTSIEWADGWTFSFPSDLPVDEMSDYLAENAG